MPMKVDGLDGFMTDIAAMAAQLDTEKGGSAAANRILEQAAVPVEQQMKENASRDPRIITDKLHGAIHTGPVRKRRSGGAAVPNQTGEPTERTGTTRIIIPPTSSMGTAALARLPPIPISGPPTTQPKTKPMRSSATVCVKPLTAADDLFTTHPA